jgi:hypothetical protein
MADKQAPMSEQQTKADGPTTIEGVAKYALNGWAIYATRKRERDEIARLWKVLAALSSRPEGPQERSELVKRIEAQIRELNRMVNGAEPSGHLLTYGEEIQLLRDCIAALSSSPAVPPEPETPRKHAWVAQLRPGVIRCQNCGTIRSNLDFSGDPCAAPETGGPR